MSRVCVLGAGSWGCALATALCENSHEVYIWARREEQVNEINNLHTNERYLPGVSLNKALKATTDLEEAIVGSRIIVLAVPSQQVRNVCKNIEKFLEKDQILVNVAKGIEESTGLRLSEVVKEELPDNTYCMLSGPSHAEEVSRKMPTAIVIASENREASEIVQDHFINDGYLRVYTNSDLVGVEIGAATKNIIAFGAGILDGLGYGDNSKAALMTRGLTEISRFGVSLGADISTFSGLSGIGDLIVTCTSMHSRNRRAGILIGQGKSVEEAKAEIRMAIEGITATEAVYKASKRLGIEMPITESIHRVIVGEKSPQEVIGELMKRRKKHENEYIFSN